jgi:hypothetical protein
MSGYDHWLPVPGYASSPLANRLTLLQHSASAAQVRCIQATHFGKDYNWQCTIIFDPEISSVACFAVHLAPREEARER